MVSRWVQPQGEVSDRAGDCTYVLDLPGRGEASVLVLSVRVVEGAGLALLGSCGLTPPDHGAYERVTDTRLEQRVGKSIVL